MDDVEVHEFRVVVMHLVNGRRRGRHDLTVDVDGAFDLAAAAVAAITAARGGYAATLHTAPLDRKAYGLPPRAVDFPDPELAELAERVLDKEQRLLAEEFDGRSVGEMLAMPGVVPTIRTYELMGVGQLVAVRCVLLFGVKRCKEVAKWVCKLQCDQEIKNRAALIVATLEKYPGGAPLDPIFRRREQRA